MQSPTLIPVAACITDVVVKRSLCHSQCLNVAFCPTEETEEWSPWTACSVTCGQGERKRTKSCGYSCTLTESSKCDLEPCPGELTLAFEILLCPVDLKRAHMRLGCVYR